MAVRDLSHRPGYRSHRGPHLSAVDDKRHRTGVLRFCIELLDQTYYAQEYESVLICAMVVLGRGESGWRDAKSYPPILSRVIKIARFMIIPKALWLDPDVV